MPAPFGPPGGGMPPQQQKKKQLPPKLFGGWTATLDDPESYQSRTIDRAETRLGGEEAIDETQPKEIFKGLNASEQMRRTRKLQQMNAMGGMPVRESRKPRPGSNRWWNNINEKVTNNPEIGKFFSEQIDKVLVNEKADDTGGAGGGRVDDRGGAGPTEGMVPFWTPKGKGDGVKERGYPKSPTGFWDGLGWLFQHGNPGHWLWGDPDYRPTVDPPFPGEKMQEHGHWVNYGGEWYRWVPGIGGADGHWESFDDHDEYLPPFDGPPSRPGEKNRDKPDIEYEHPPGSGVWFEWIPDPNHPDGGTFSQPRFIDPTTDQPTTHPFSPNYDWTKPDGGGSRL